MKGPLVLVLISTLIAAPLFADTITLKSGQTYEGEILEKTSEYIKLKTESQVLRIEMSTIAKIKTPKGEYGVDVKARPALYPDIVAKAEAAAEAHVNKMLGFSAGCLGGVATCMWRYSAFLDELFDDCGAGGAELPPYWNTSIVLLLGLAGIITAYSLKPSSPQSHLVGKSPEYVELFTKAYQQKARSIQMKGAIGGVLAGSMLACLVILLVPPAVE